MDQAAWVWLAGAIGYLGGVALTFFTHVLQKIIDDRLSQKQKQIQGRKELQAQIRLFCDKWNHREIIAPLNATFRKELVQDIMEVQENLRLNCLDIPIALEKEIMQLTLTFLEIAGLSQNKSDIIWYTEQGTKIDVIIRRLSEISSRSDGWRLSFWQLFLVRLMI